MGRSWGWGNLQEEEVRRRGPWTAQEDKLLIEYVSLHGEGRWNSVATSSGLKRSGKSCRLRWVNYLRPDLKKGQITPHEEHLIVELHARWGNRWSTIARSLPGRTDNEIKNYWRTHFKKKNKLSQGSEEHKTQHIKQQQQQQQHQQQQQQQQHRHLFPVNKTMAHLEENDNKIIQADGRSEMILYPNSDEQYFSSMVFASTSLLATSSEGDLWGDLWNLDDANIMEQSCATSRVVMQNQPSSFW